MDIASYFDDLPRSLGRRREPVFSEMVRYLMERPNCDCPMSEFGRQFPGAKQVFLKPFNFITPSHGRCLISLRTKDGTFPELVKARIDNRVELTCKHGHRLIKDEGIWSDSALTDKVCFSCNVNELGQCFYSCGHECVFHICKSCMVFGKLHIEEPPAKRLCASQEASSSASRPAAAASRPVLICLIRGHVLRSGGRLSENALGDWQDLHTVFRSIKIETEK